MLSVEQESFKRILIIPFSILAKDSYHKKITRIDYETLPSVINHSKNTNHCSELAL